MSESGWIEMNFPADMPKMADNGSNGSLPSAEALGQALGLGSGSEVVAIGRGKFDILCELSPTAFDRIKPDQSALAQFECRGVCVTTQGCDGRDEERARAAALVHSVHFSFGATTITCDIGMDRVASAYQNDALVRKTMGNF